MQHLLNPIRPDFWTSGAWTQARGMCSLPYVLSSCNRQLLRASSGGWEDLRYVPDSRQKDGMYVTYALCDTQFPCIHNPRLRGCSW